MDVSYKLLFGNSINKIKEIDDNSIYTVVTSPPYYGLRDYGTGKWVGGDPNCNHFRDSKISQNDISTAHKNMENLQLGVGDAIYKKMCPKCGAIRIDEQIGLEETPEEYIERLVSLFREIKRVLKDDGTLWVNLGDSYNNGATGNRSNWSKKQSSNKGSLAQTSTKHMVEGCKQKDLIGIPWMFAFAMRNDGWYLRQDIIWHKPNPMPESVSDRCTKSHEYIFLFSKSPKYYFDSDAIKENTLTFDDSVRDRDITKLNNTPGRTKMGGLTTNHYEKRNKRDVWSVTTKPFKEAHFATFPEDLILPCILAGCPENETVLDPFNGSGTTGVVALKNNRNYIGIDLNKDYIEMSERRLKEISSKESLW